MFPTLNSSTDHYKRVQCDVMRAELKYGPNVLFCFVFLLDFSILPSSCSHERCNHFSLAVIVVYVNRK